MTSTTARTMTIDTVRLFVKSRTTKKIAEIANEKLKMASSLSVTYYSKSKYSSVYEKTLKRPNFLSIDRISSK